MAPPEGKNNEKVIPLTEPELEEIISKSVQSAFISMGIDAQDPIEMQKDFQHLREFRYTTEKIRAKTILSLVGLFVVGFASLIWLGLKAVGKGG